MGKSRALTGRCEALRRHQYHCLPGLSLERTTGFEPATLTLAINNPLKGAQLLYLHLRKIAAER